MPFALCPGETEVWSTTTRTGPSRGAGAHLTVTTHRVIAMYSHEGDTHDLWIPLDMVDSATYGRFRNQFSIGRFIVLLLLFIVPGLIYLLAWLFGRNDVMVVTAGGEERVKVGLGILQGGVPTEFLDAIACARHSLMYGAPAGPPVRVTLTP